MRSDSCTCTFNQHCIHLYVRVFEANVLNGSRQQVNAISGSERGATLAVGSVAVVSSSLLTALRCRSRK